MCSNSQRDLNPQNSPGPGALGPLGSPSTHPPRARFPDLRRPATAPSRPSSGPRAGLGRSRARLCSGSQRASLPAAPFAENVGYWPWPGLPANPGSASSVVGFRLGAHVTRGAALEAERSSSGAEPTSPQAAQLCHICQCSSGAEQCSRSVGVGAQAQLLERPRGECERARAGVYASSQQQVSSPSSCPVQPPTLASAPSLPRECERARPRRASLADSRQQDERREREPDLRAVLRRDGRRIGHHILR